MLRSVPLIVIIGSTGTGKTKLSIELARRFAGEIISADSMQVYRGLDVATAKATAAEQSAAVHHLLDVAQPGQPYTVVDFRDAAVPIVDRLLGADRVPIVVGGTNYYIESLLWQVLLDPPATLGDKRRRSPSHDASERADAKRHTEPAIERPIAPDAQLEAMPADTLHALLAQVDRRQANRLHPNNRRKVIRALQVFRDCGRTLSAVLDEQRRAPGGSGLGGPLRYEHVLLFWLRCDQPVLEARLDRRIDDMIGAGLLQEIRQFHDGLRSDGGDAPVVYSKGILQAIGFKEFIPYLERFDAAEDRRITEHIRHGADSNDGVPEGLPLLQTCLDELRLVTKRYAKKQMKWVANRFLATGDRCVPPVYALDTSDVSMWSAEVFGRAEAIVRRYMDGTLSADAADDARMRPMERHESRRAGLSEDVTNVCETCARTFIGEFQWRIHLKSNKHKRASAAAATKRKQAATDDNQ